MLLYSVAMGKHAITALQWSCIAMCHKSPPISSLLTSQAVFLTATASSTKLWGKATKILSSLHVEQGRKCSEGDNSDTAW